MKLSSIGLIALSFVSVVSCSNDHPVAENSSLNSVANPGDPGSPNVLYWQDKTDSFKAACTADKPTTRENCAIGIIKTPSADITKRATEAGQRTLDASVAAVAAEIKTLKDADPSIQSLANQVAILTNQKNALDAGIAAETKQIAAYTASKAQLDAQIAADDAQLAAIAKELVATPNDPDLLALQAKVQSERNTFAASSAVVATRIASAQQHLAWQQATLAAVTANLKARQDELKKTYDELMVTSAKLDQLKAAQAFAQASLNGIPSVMKFIANADVTYRGNLWAAPLQDSLRLIDSAFSGTTLLNAGRYKVESGSSSLCPQKVVPTSQGNVVKLNITYLSPCSGTTNTYTCDKNVCRYSSVTVTVLDSTHYNYRDGSYNAVFKFDSARMDVDFEVGGPERSK